MHDLTGGFRCKCELRRCLCTNAKMLEGQKGIEFQPLLFIGESRVLRLLRG